MVLNYTDIVHVPEGTGTSYLMRTDVITFKVTSQETHGAVLLLEAAVPPQGGPPMHTHPEQETFYVLEGTFEISGIRDQRLYTVQATPGSAVTIIPNAPHAYKNVGTTPGKLLALFTPATIQNFFEEVGEPIPDPTHPPAPSNSPETIARFISIGKKYHFEVVQPPKEHYSA